VPGLTDLMQQLASRQVRVVEVETQAASPFARSLLFGYVGMFLYEGDAPLAERRAQALSLDATLLAELLGSTDLRELLDPVAITTTEAELQRLAPDRRVSGVDAVHDLLRVVGDLRSDEAIVRGATPQELALLEEARRAIRVRIAGEERWLAIEDAGRVRDALGVALPVGIPEAFTEPVRDPLGDLVARYARTHGPFLAEDVAARFGLGTAVTTSVLERMRATGRIVLGDFRVDRPPVPDGRHGGREWSDAEVLRTIRRRSLAALRREIEPVPPEELARFLPGWQGLGHSATRGVDGLLRTVEQLAGVPLPVSALETLVLPSRVADYAPGWLDELTLAGEIVWAGAGSLPNHDGWIVLAPTDSADLLLPLPESDSLEPLHRALLDALDGDQALFYRALADRASAAGIAGVDDSAIAAAIWDLVWAGWLTNDTLGPVRSLLGASRSTTQPRRRRTPRGRYARYAGLAAGAGSGQGRAAAARTAPPAMAGRWSRLPQPEADPTRRAVALADVLLDRYGVVTRGAVVAESVSGGFSAVYPVLKAAEESGRVRRGYFVEGLGASQFAAPGAIDRLRTQYRGREEATASALVVAAADPANPYGAALPWPDRPASIHDDPALPTGDTDTARPATKPGRRGHQPARKAGALVVLVDGGCAIYVERGGRTVLSFTDDPGVLQPAADALALAVRDGALGRLSVERADGAAVVTSPLGDALEAAGFRPTPRGLRLRG